MPQHGGEAARWRYRERNKTDATARCGGARWRYRGRSKTHATAWRWWGGGPGRHAQGRVSPRGRDSTKTAPQTLQALCGSPELLRPGPADGHWRDDEFMSCPALWVSCGLPAAPPPSHVERTVVPIPRWGPDWALRSSTARTAGAPPFASHARPWRISRAGEHRGWGWRRTWLFGHPPVITASFNSNVLHSPLRFFLLLFRDEDAHSPPQGRGRLAPLPGPGAQFPLTMCPQGWASRRCSEHTWTEQRGLGAWVQ